MKNQPSKRRSMFWIATVLLMFAVMVIFAAACAGEENIANSPYLVRLEAEAGQVILAGGATGDIKYSVASSKSENITSGGKFVSALKEKGDRLVWTFAASEAAETDVYLALANAVEGADYFTVGSGNVFSARINGASVAVPLTRVAAADKYCDAWQLIKLAGVPLKPGLNTFSVEMLDTENLVNIDYLGVYARNLAVQEHVHSWNTSTVPATCEKNGRTDRTCSDCGLAYHFRDITALGHNYSSFHYDEESALMVQECANCRDKKYANAPDSKYFGEVFESKNEFSTRKSVETVYEAESARVCIDGGLNNGTSPIEYYSGSSGGAHVANISNLGNYIEFTVLSTKDCKADLLLVLANVLYTSNGIGILSPMSNYVSFTVNGESVDFSYVDFPGDKNYNYYNWRYVVMKDVDLTNGENILVFAPKDNTDNITIPNTDTLYLYTSEDCLTVKYTYDISDAFIDNDYESAYGVENVFTQSGDSFIVKSGTLASGDLVITINALEEYTNISNNLTIEINGLRVKIDNLPLSKGDNKLIIKDFHTALGVNKLTYSTKQGVIVKGASLFTENTLPQSYYASVNEDYNYFINEGVQGAKVPVFIYEAEDADFGSSSSSTGNPMIANSTTASGGRMVENFGRRGNSITWKFKSDGAFVADVAIRMACSNWSNQINGNEDMINLSRYITITVDGVEMDLTEVDLKCSSPTSWTDWTAVAATGIKLDGGEHTVAINYKSDNFPNTDVMYIYTNDVVSIEKVEWKT